MHLTNGQRRILDAHREECRWVYNHTLAVRRDAYDQPQATLGLYATQSRLPEWKAARPSLQRVQSQVLQNVHVRVDLACKACFRRGKAGEKKAGYPRFTGFGRYDRMTYPQYGNGARRAGDTLIRAQIGAVLVNRHRPLEGRLTTVTLRRHSTGTWVVCCSVEQAGQPTGTAPEPAVGVAGGLAQFATLSTGETIAHPRFFRRDAHDLQRTSRKLRAAAKGTPERAQRRTVVARMHERIANRRKNCAHQLSRTLVNQFGVIVVADVHLARMRNNHCLAKSIADAAWNQLASSTRSTVEDAGST